ncbi:MAG: RNA polymerase sigma factor [Hyphomonadaceae bacterium]|nr:RNA polymerase sigma factor [Hyphomonadaceae bacterium]
MTALAPPATAPDAGRSEEQRFLAFLESQQRILYKIAYIYCRDAEERRDLMQEMAIHLWRAYPSFEGRSAPTTWTYRVAVNVAISYRRGQGRRLRETLPLDFATDVADQAFAPPNEQTQRLHALIETLDEMSRALVLLYLEGFDHGEIAALLGISASNVSTRLNRIKAKLQAEHDLIKDDAP